MKPYHKQNQPQRRLSPDGSATVHRYPHPIRTTRPNQRAVQRPERAAVPVAVSQPPTELHRYVHPIRTGYSPARPTVEDLLGEVLEALSRQSELLEEALRRLERAGQEG